MADIPDKRYFRIGEVCELADVKPHVLRYWEAEFSVIRPQRDASKQRLYRRVDVENILAISKLLYEEGFTIAGAKKALAAARRKGAEVVKQEVKPPASEAGKPTDQKLFKGIKDELLSLKELLEG